MKDRETVARELAASLNELKQIRKKSRGLYKNLKVAAAHKVVRSQYGKGGLFLPLGYYCPSPIYDRITGGINRGRIFKGTAEPGKYDHEYGFDHEGRLVRVLCYCIENEPVLLSEHYTVWGNETLLIYHYEGGNKQVTRATFEDGNISRYEYCNDYEF